MNILRLSTLILLALMISACSTTSGYWGESNWSEEHTQLQANQYIAEDGSVRTYEAPRKYNVTSEDIEKYNAINDRIAQRKAEIHQQQQLPNHTTDTGLTHTAPSASYNPYAPPSSNHNPVSQGETNY